MQIKCQKTSQKYILNKFKQNNNQIISSNTLSFVQLSDLQRVAPSKLSFDNFFYKDHVTFKKYSCQHLKKHHLPQRFNTESSSDQKWKKTQNIKMINLIQYIDLWKSIKQNRNNILVYGKKRITNKQKNQAYLQLSTKDNISIKDNTQTQKAHYINLTKYKKLKILSRQDSIELQKTYSQRKLPSKRILIKDNDQKQSKCDQMGRLKRKMNNQIYRMNKVLLSDYLKDEKQYDESFNYLIKNEDNLQSKLKKIHNLVQILKQKNYNQNYQKQFNQCIQSQNYQSNCRKIDIQQDRKYIPLQQKFNLNPLCGNSNGNQVNELTNNQNKHKKLQILHAKAINKDCKLLIQSKHSQQTLNIRKKQKKILLRFSNSGDKQNIKFQRQQKIMDEQIKAKYRRDAEFLLNKNNKHKFIYFN